MKHKQGILLHRGGMKMRANGAHDAKGRRKYLTREEGQKFLAVAAKLPPGKRLFCLTIYYTGCRISEALAIVPERLDGEASAVLIQTLKKRGNQAYRRVPVPKFLMDELLGLCSQGNGERLWKFCRSTGWRTVKRAMDEAGVLGIHSTVRALRHSFGVRGALGKIPVTVIQRWLGHADLKTTSIYLEVLGPEERELIERTW